ncbi:MAG: tetratricopeptide repeat protein, partial [Myxococcales bacterium]|nr:tetratricopeptide repeat protein [Myxococcales bacterium]
RAARAALEDGRASLRKGDPASAIEEFSRGLERAPNDAKLIAERGYAYLLADRLDEADADMRRALPLEPSPDAQAAIWYNRGQVAEKRGQRDAALDAYEKSLALRPHPKVEAARDRVRAAAP